MACPLCKELFGEPPKPRAVCCCSVGPEANGRVLPVCPGGGREVILRSQSTTDSAVTSVTDCAIPSPPNSWEQAKQLQAGGHVTENWANNPVTMMMRGFSPPSPQRGVSFRGRELVICLSVILTFRMLRQEDYKFKDCSSRIRDPISVKGKSSHSSR